MNPMLLAMLLQAGLGAAQGGIGAAQNASQENTRRKTAEGQRARLQGIIDRIRDVNYADVDMAQSSAYTSALNQAGASAASRGVSGGVKNATQDRVLSGAIADLARFKTQDQLAREREIADIYGNDAFSVPEGEMDVFGQLLLGGLLGAAGGGAEGLGNAIGTGEWPGPGGGAQLSNADASFNEGVGDLSANLTRRANRGDGGLSSMSAPALPSGGGGGTQQFSAGAGLFDSVLDDMLVRSSNTSIQRG